MTESQYDVLRSELGMLRSLVRVLESRLDSLEKDIFEDKLDRGNKHAAIMGLLQTIRAQTKTMGIDPLPLHLTEEQAAAAVKGLTWRDADGNPVAGPCADRIALAESKEFAERVSSGQSKDQSGLSNAEVL